MFRSLRIRVEREHQQYLGNYTIGCSCSLEPMRHCWCFPGSSGHIEYGWKGNSNNTCGTIQRLLVFPGTSTAAIVSFYGKHQQRHRIDDMLDPSLTTIFSFANISKPAGEKRFPRSINKPRRGDKSLAV